MQLLVESLRLGTPVALGADGRPVVRAGRRRQHRHRGHDARRRPAPASRPTPWSATVRSRGPCGWRSASRSLTGGLIAPAPRPAVGHLPRRPDHLGRGDQPAGARRHGLPALRGPRRLRDLHRRAHQHHRPAPPVRHPDRRAAAVHEQADLLRHVRRDRRLTAWCSSARPFGLRVRSVGENPHAAETLGIDPIRIRYRAVVIGGVIAGLAGAWFSLESQSGFQDNMTNGAGFIALAALIFGKWRPSTAFAGAILFGFTRALGARLQILQVTIGDFSIPSEFLQSLPYVVTIIVVAGAIGSGHRAGRRRRALRAIPMSRPSTGTRSEAAAVDACAPGLRAVLRLPGRGGRAGRRRPGAHRVQRRERVVRPHPVRGVRAGVRAPRHRRWPPGGGGVRRREGPAAGAVRPLPPAAPRARRAGAPVQRSDRSASCCPTPSAPTTCRDAPDGRHRPDPAPSATAGGSPTSRSTGSSAPTPTGDVADEQAAALLMAILFRGLEPDELARWTQQMIATGTRADLSGPRPPHRRQALHRRRRRQDLAGAVPAGGGVRRGGAPDRRAGPRPHRRHARQDGDDPRVALHAGRR